MAGVTGVAAGDGRARAAVYGFPDCAGSARHLADALRLPCYTATLHRFPDGESLVRLPVGVDRAILYCAFERPNDRLIELMLAASVLRRQGARELTLVAPYLPYMRQDAAFREGEPVSQQVVGSWLAGLFDRIVAVDPHLHRTGDLKTVFPGCMAISLTAAPLVAEHLKASHAASDTVIVGPDEEAADLAAAVARPLGLAHVTATKTRRGDREVEVLLPDGFDLRGRPAVIVDDVVSSGGTMIECARAVLKRGAVAVEAVTVHALYRPDLDARFREAGIVGMVSCDGISHPSNRIRLDRLIASALADLTAT